LPDINPYVALGGKAQLASCIIKKSSHELELLFLNMNLDIKMQRSDHYLAHWNLMGIMLSTNYTETCEILRLWRLICYYLQGIVVILVAKAWFSIMTISEKCTKFNTTLMDNQN